MVRISSGVNMKSYSSREVMQILKANGWYEVGVVGSHHHFKHPTKKGKTTIPHPNKDLPGNTVRGIGKQTGIKFP